jgi:hypothetical protein
VPVTPFPAVIAHRLNTTPVEAEAITAMLESPGLTPGSAVNAKSSNVTPVARFCTSSANPWLVGASFAWSAALYVHCVGVVVQSSPPYTATPSREVPTTRFSVEKLPTLGLPHA